MMKNGVLLGVFGMVVAGASWAAAGDAYGGRYTDSYAGRLIRMGVPSYEQFRAEQRRMNESFGGSSGSHRQTYQPAETPLNQIPRDAEILTAAAATRWLGGTKFEADLECHAPGGVVRLMTAEFAITAAPSLGEAPAEMPLDKILIKPASLVAGMPDIGGGCGEAMLVWLYNARVGSPWLGITPGKTLYIVIHHSDVGERSLEICTSTAIRLK